MVKEFELVVNGFPHEGEIEEQGTWLTRLRHGQVHEPHQVATELNHRGNGETV
jgi:hypothetical protein